MSLEQCKTCKGTRLICPSCDKPRHYGTPHPKCSRHQRCPEHVESFHACDICHARLPQHFHQGQFYSLGGDTHLDLCPECHTIAERELKQAALVALDRLKELRTEKGAVELPTNVVQFIPDPKSKIKVHAIDCDMGVDCLCTPVLRVAASYKVVSTTALSSQKK